MGIHFTCWMRLSSGGTTGNSFPHSRQTIPTHILHTLIRRIMSLGCVPKRLGVADNCIYYNGPYKKKDVLKDVLLRGAHVNIDSLEEAIRIVEIAQEHADRILLITT